MSLLARVPWQYVSAFVHPFSAESLGWHSGHLVGSLPASAGYPALNRAHYFPIVIPSPCTIYRFFWLNGAVQAGSYQVGVYYDATDGPGDSFLLGTSTVASGANVCQFDNVTDTALPPGRWWIAIWGSSASGNLFRLTPSTVNGRWQPGYLESSLSSGLPSNATPAQQTTPYIPVFGFTTIASP